MKSEQLGARFIAIPRISSGTFGGPKQIRGEILVKTLDNFSRNLKDRPLPQVYLVNTDDEATTILRETCRQIVAFSTAD